MTRRDAASERQVQAADPGGSVWLSANAGSGKTRVLTDRVARLLLNGVSPQNILCLTYTKAAVSEMQNRLFRRLGDWAMQPDADLRAALAELGADRGIDDALLARARRLFARAIETPGGLKIQTIHSFCAALLRRFPLEAGVSPQFIELDERAAKRLREEVVDAMADNDDGAVRDLAAHYTGEDFAALTQDIAKHRAAFLPAVSHNDILAHFGLRPDAAPEDALTIAFDGTEPDLIDRLAPLCAGQTKTYSGFGERLATLDLESPDLAVLETLFKEFLYQSGTNADTSKSVNFPQSGHPKAVDALAPVLLELHAFMDRVAAAKAFQKQFAAAERTTALHRFARPFLAAMAARKLALGWLDFDDLILKARDLLNDARVAQWVLFRLDGGIDHILIDEAQDTSPAQWDVIERLAQEFSAGEGARTGVERTIFVVGDKKQSIYSFQGADPDGFRPDAGAVL